MDKTLLHTTIRSLAAVYQTVKREGAVLNTISACQAYVDTNSGRWPNSWADIDTLVPDSRDGGVHDRVTVDFDADPRVLATQDSDHFTGIVADSPVYIHGHEIESLLNTLRRYHPQASDDG